MKSETILIFLLIFSTIGCRKSKTPDIIIDVNVVIHYTDSSGKELFSNGANGYVAGNLRLFYMLNGIKTLVYTAPTAAVIPDYPYGYILDSSASVKYYSIFSNSYVINDTAITFIDLKPNVEDTLKCSFIHPNSNSSSIACDKVWYNGKLMSRNFSVMK